MESSHCRGSQWDRSRHDEFTDCAPLGQSRLNSTLSCFLFQALPIFCSSLKFALPLVHLKNNNTFILCVLLWTLGQVGQSEAGVNLSPLTQTLAQSWTRRVRLLAVCHQPSRPGTHITKGKAGATTEDKGYLRKRSAAVVENMNHPAQCPLWTCRVNIPHLYSNDSHRTDSLHYSRLTLRNPSHHFKSDSD